jgi:Flp pilus assembly protein TadB
MIAAALAFAACWMAMSHVGPQRLARASIGPRRRQVRDGAQPTGMMARPTVRIVVCVASGAVVGDLLFGSVGLPLGIIAGAVGAVLLGRLEPLQVRRERERAESDLPLAIDLLAACAAAGRPIDRALVAVADAMGDPLAGPFRRVAHRLMLGGDATAGWAAVSDRPELVKLGRTMARMTRVGAPLTSTLVRLAEDQRRERRWRNERRARAVGVRAAGPLAACFLPAFMLVGVVPTIVGMVGHLGF